LNQEQACAECGHDEVEWVSLTIGVTLCATCASIHRALGTRI
ncbi:unnamed protein product, partial [Discosporangium mesarthrocarpum]